MHDTLLASANMTANGVRELREENISLASKLGESERLHGIAEAELAMYKERLAEVQQQCDFYMRYSVELTTQLNTIQMIVADSMEKAKSSVYRPTMAAPPQVEEPEGEENPPSFLSLGPRKESVA